MGKQLKKSNNSSGEGLLWLFGAILAIQGFGSAIMEAGGGYKLRCCRPSAGSPRA
jgi:hypothetical protein